jgi:callose synthase
MVSFPTLLAQELNRSQELLSSHRLSLLSSLFSPGHPDAMDKIFFITRGGMSKASKMLHVSEDIFAGFKSTLRGGRILHKEYIQVGKGRDLGFNQLFLFEAKLASGAGEQALSREAYRLGRYLDLPRLLSFFYGSIGFYTTTAMVVLSIASLLFARMMLALTGIDKNVVEFNHQFGISVGLLQASSVYQLGILLILPMLAEIALEKTLVKALTTYLWMLMTGQFSGKLVACSRLEPPVS